MPVRQAGSDQEAGVNHHIPVNYDQLPGHMRESTRAYIETGRPVGDFLTAVLQNNLMEAFRRADDKNRAAMPEWVCFLHNEAPADCYGSRQAVKAWRERGGMNGKAGAA